ncbi:MAG: transposase [Clostridia bacterium]|nr:transposase [Clostridia bacterium]
MPRQAREFSESGYMHLIARGIGRQALFEEDEDYEFYLSILRRFCRETGIAVCAYCLMENHVHLLVHDEKEQVPILMKKLGVSYSGYFNKKYERVGHLFQDRYLSEAIKDDAHLLTVVRYILNNPLKAGICAARDYPWSSYALFASPSTFLDTRILQDLLGDGERYIAFIAESNDDKCLDCDMVPRSDRWARAVIQECLGFSSGTALQGMDRQQRNAALQQLKQKGLSVRQIERLTGISRNIVQRA